MKDILIRHVVFDILKAIKHMRLKSTYMNKLGKELLPSLALNNKVKADHVQPVHVHVDR